MAAPKRVSATDIRRWTKYIAERNDAGKGVAKAAQSSGVPLRSAYRFERGDQGSTGLEVAKILGVTMVDGVMLAQPIDPVAQQALEDFELFRLRYTGRRSRRWQLRAAEDVLRYLATDNREYIVNNEPPGSGKTTLFTHDIPAWLIARDRRIRILFGSRTERQARKYLRRLKNTLEREAPLRAEPDDLARGLSVDAVAAMSQDYTAFRPPDRTEAWTSDQLNVRQLDGTTRDDKEPTVSAYGMDSGYLGDRVDVFIWDDLVDKKNSRVAETRIDLEDRWDTEAESRLEPGGLGILQGQRIQHNDLYRHNIDKRNLDGTPKYHHILYKAHYDELCVGHHSTEVPTEERAWPNGCLLDPWRIPWVGPDGLETLKHNSPRTYSVLYQQEDGDHVGGLVEDEWITGGVDSTGYDAPGCLDLDRVAGVVPVNLTDGNGFSFVAVDPSPAQFWSIGWWCYDGEASRWNLIDLVNERMNPGVFLDYDVASDTHSGIMVDWHLAALKERAPLRYAIIEDNAAQRWLLDQPHVQDWAKRTGVRFIPHGTYGNKADPKFGVESTGELFRHGRIRIPWADPRTRLRMQPLITEALRYDGTKDNVDDNVMMTWFAKLAGERLWVPRSRTVARKPVPSHVRAAQRGMARQRGLAGWRPG